MNKFTYYLAASALLLTTFLAFGHSEHDKARFVSPEGKDSGNCDNVLRPCKTIGYAATRANKGDKILVAAGTYQIDKVEDLFYLQSNIVPIKGGYNRFDHYQNQSPNINVSTLVGVPPEFAKQFEQYGFNVITDIKSIEENKALQEKIASYAYLSQSQKNVACENGMAGSYECNNVDLLGHMPLNDFSINVFAGSDIWGHVDLNTGREYAIMGFDRGTAVVDVTDPDAPQEVGAISGRSTTWRDIKVYQFFDHQLNLWQAYAYVTLDGTTQQNTDNVTIIDLNNLPHAISVVEQNRTVYKAHNVYISNVDYTLNIANSDAAPILHLAGTNRSEGQFVNYDLSNPKTISKLTGSYSTSHDTGTRPYSHDVASMTITDNRKDNDCVNGTVFCSVFIDFNETEMLLWDITDSADVSSLGKATYGNAEYVHSGWSTEDNKYIFLHDELDERNNGLSTTVRVFDVTDLNEPTQVGDWEGPYRAIDHNGFVRGNRYYMSNYERGLTILDITNPKVPAEVGFFDTFPVGNSFTFSGAWGVYPFLPSGNILVSDINSGLYILKDNTKSLSNDEITFPVAHLSTLQDMELALVVKRSGSNTENAVTVDYQIIQGSAEKDADYSGQDGTLTWAANDTDDKVINITIADDPTGQEYTENFFIRLFNPQNGASLGEHSYLHITIAGILNTGSVSFATDSVTVAENSGQHIVEVSRIGSVTGELTVDYALSSEQATIGEDIEQASGQLTWLDGDSDNKQITITLIDDELEEGTENVTLTLTPLDNGKLGTYGELTIAIADDDQNTAPTVTVSENFQANTGQFVTLTAQATDAESDEMTFLWQQTAGTSVTLANADSLSATFTAPSSAGSLTFELTATDFKGASSSAQVTVTVVAAPQTDTSSKKSSGGGSINWLLLLLLLPIAVRRNSIE